MTTTRSAPRTGARRTASSILILVVLLAAAPAALAQGTRLLREPTISDAHIAFVHANDLWIVDRDGGDAVRLTSHDGGERVPHFSPDGRTIAFSGEYGANTDVYVVPADGGEPRRLTWHPGTDVVQGWTPDGSAVVFRSSREGHPTARARFFTVPVDGSLPEALAIPQAWSGELSADGRFIAYQEFGFFDPEWRNYRGGQAQPVRIVSMDDYTLEKTPWEGARHMDPVWLDGVVYFLSERDWASNIWSYDPRTDELRQRTRHADFDVKSLDAGGGVVVYEQGGWLHLLDPATDETRRLEVRVRGDLNRARPRWTDIEPRRITSAALSPTGKRVALEARGEVFTVPAEHGDWRNLSSSSGGADRFPVWSPDGANIAWFSDAEGEYRLVIRDQKGLEPAREIALPSPTFYFRPAWSPDGRYIAYTDADMNVWYVDIESGEATRVDTESRAYPDRSMHPVWSPDSRWIAYARRLDNHLRAIFVHDVRTGETRQVTDGMSDAISPSWDATGKYLWFLASTDFALNTGWLDMSSYDRPVTRGVYLAVLAADEPSPLLPRSDEEEPGAGAGGEGQGSGADRQDEGGSASGDDSGDEGAGDVVVRIDFEGLQQRILALDVPERDYAALLAGPDGTVFYGERVDNQPGMTLHRYTFEDREAEELLAPVQSVWLSHDRNKMLYRSGQRWGIVDTKGQASVGDGALALDGLRMKLDPRAEWRQIFREGWRYQRDFLYVDNIHGAPWDDIYDWYRPWVEHVRHRSDLNYVLDIMGGEVSLGHSYTGGGDFPDLDEVPVGLLGADLEESDGRYRVRTIYTAESWNPNMRAPLSGPGIDVAEGEYILAVNGNDLRAADNPFRLLDGTAGRQTTLLVNDRPTTEGAREVTVVPVRSEFGLRTRAWVEANRRKVDELSDGRLAYVWLPNTAGAGYTAFNRYYFAQQNKQGAVIDERNNGGGSAADYIVDILDRDLQGYFNSPVGDRRPWTLPEAGLWGPKVMLINESAGSGGDLLPFLFRQMEIGPLIGTRTWGGLVGIWDVPPLIDGGRMTAPRGGFINLQGEWDVEGEGVAPDIPVEQTPADVIAGRDPQLERAVEEALRLLETERVELLTSEPPPPVKWRRPARETTSTSSGSSDSGSSDSGSADSGSSDSGSSGSGSADSGSSGSAGG